MKTKSLFVVIALSAFAVLFSHYVHAADEVKPKEKSGSEQTTLLSFEDADLRDVLRLIANEFDLNMVMGDEVQGTVTINLKGATLQSALDAILVPRGYDYEIRDSIVRVGSRESLEIERTQRAAKLELEPLVSEVFVLKYLDANDVSAMIKPVLSARGSLSVLSQRTYKGFRFSSQNPGNSTGGSTSSGGQTSDLVRERQGGDTSRSSTLMVVDVRAQIDKVKDIIAQVDKPPRQVLIDARILEVTTDSLEDLGIDFAGDSTYTSNAHERTNQLTTDVNSGSSSGSINSNIFTNTFPTNTDAGMHAVFRRLNGSDYNVTLHALLQDERTKTLSAPKILTVENQESAILVGEQFPIFEANISDQGTTTESLSFFQPVGIILQVVVNVTPENEISMIIHPTVSSIGNLVTGTTGLTQPRINIREADTRVLMKNKETLVIGGLLEDVEDEKYFKFPILGYIPYIDKLFTRRQTSLEQRNLLIFISPQVVEAGDIGMSEFEQDSFRRIKDPQNQGFLYENRLLARTIFQAAKKNYNNSNYNAAKAQFLKVLALDPAHDAARKYLGEIEARQIAKTA